MASNQLAVIRRSRRCTRSNEGWDEGTADPSESKLAKVTEAIIPDSLAVAAAARFEDYLRAKTACRS